MNLYFEDGAPKQSLYADSYYGFAGSNLILTTGFYGNFNIQDRIDILGQTPTSDKDSSGYYAHLPADYGDFELCKFRVYEGNKTGGLSGKRWINLYCQTWFAREEIIKVDVEDTDSEWGFEKPEGDGWHMRLPIKKNGKNAHTWTRKPFNGAYESSWTLGNIIENTSNISNTWYWSKYLESSINYPTSTSTGNLKTSINFKDFFEYLFSNSATELIGMKLKSTFFLNDDEDTFMSLVGSHGNNYVTGNKNYLNNCRFIFTKDIQPEESDKKNKVVKISIKKLFDELNKLFCNTLGFFIDDSGSLRIEHISIIDLYKNSINISNLDEIKFTSKWSFDKQQMFEKFEFNMVNSAYPDFCNNTTTFDKMVSNNRNQDSKLSLETTLISSDIKYCILNPSEISDGIILCAFDSKNILINSKCILSGEVEPNGVLSLSNILYDFATYEGIWIQGKINELYSNFRNTKRTKLGIEITLKGFYESMFFNTQFGIGMLDGGSIDFTNEITKIKLRYRYDSGVENDLFRIMFQKATDSSDSIDVIADIGNYEIELNSFFSPELIL